MFVFTFDRLLKAMKNNLIIAVVFIACSGCASVELLRMSHWFESNLYVGELSIPHLRQSEWKEIKSQFSKRTNYSFHQAIRESSDRVMVDLELKSDRSHGMELRFDRKAGKWLEDESKAREIVYLVPFE